MKKILFILTFISLIAANNVTLGQRAVEMKVGSTTGTTGGTTVYQTTAKYLYFPALLDHKCGSIQATATRVSAAMGGTLTLQASNDNSNWFYTGEDDVISVNNAATSTGVINISPEKGILYANYRLECIGLTSDTMTVRAFVLFRQ